jgi:hypothetical protein
VNNISFENNTFLFVLRSCFYYFPIKSLSTEQTKFVAELFDCYNIFFTLDYIILNPLFLGNQVITSLDL